MCADSIISNVYIKIPDNNVCTQAVLCDIASKIDRELTLLDSKFVPVMDDDDKGEYVIINARRMREGYCNHPVCLCVCYRPPKRSHTTCVRAYQCILRCTQKILN